MTPQRLQTILERDKDGTWYYIHVPKAVRDRYKALEKRGTIPVTVTIGASSWQGSMLPWADGSAQISVNKKIRTKEKLKLGDDLQVLIEPRER